MIAVVGLSHRTTPIALRERIAFDATSATALLTQLRSEQDVAEVMLLSTCNRTELIAAADTADSCEYLISCLKACFVGRLPELDHHLYLHGGTPAIEHVFRVVSSLDSLVVGEPQILGQFKEAFELARQHGTVGNRLHRVVARALRTAKRVRHETQVGAGQVSIPTVALDLARQIFGDMAGHTLALLGTGEMGELVARLFVQSGTRLVIVGRNPTRVRELQERYQADGRSMDDLERSLLDADILVTSTSSAVPIVDSTLLRKAMRKRRGRDLFIVDVAVPRDVNADVDALDGVYRYDVDDLAAVVGRSLGSREREASRAERIVQEEVSRFERWVEGEQVTPLVRTLRQHIGSVLHRELGRSLKSRLKHLSENERLHLERMVEAAVNKLMHEPTVQLRKMATENPDELEQATTILEDIFGISEARNDSSPLNSDPDSVLDDDSAPATTEDTPA